MEPIDVPGAPFTYDATFRERLAELDQRVANFRHVGRLDAEGLRELSRFFRIRTIYNSNAIEGNSLDEGETRQVIEQGMTIAGRSMKDHLEAHNLSDALDFFETLARGMDPITEHDIRQIHALILRRIDDDNAGLYRKREVEVTGSDFKPTPYLEVPHKMREFSDWFQQVSARGIESNPVALAAAAHAWFVQIHPFIDGNGRTARILLNIIMMRYQYPIPVITTDERQRYYDALEASQWAELTPFISLVYEDILESLEIYEENAKRRIQDQASFARLGTQLVSPIDESEAQEIAVFSAAMDLLASQFERAVTELRDQGAQVYFKHFDRLTTEKYLQIKRTGRARRTWAFRVDFRRGNRSARYLFWFWKTGWDMQAKSAAYPVSLLISREHPPDGHYYVLLDEIAGTGREDLPEIREISYDAKAERFICRFSMGYVAEHQVADVVKTFVEQVVSRNFAN